MFGLASMNLQVGIPGRFTLLETAPERECLR